MTYRGITELEKAWRESNITFFFYRLQPILDEAKDEKSLNLYNDFRDKVFGVVQKNDPRVKTIADILNRSTGVSKKEIKKMFVPGEEFSDALFDVAFYEVNGSFLKDVYYSWIDNIYENWWQINADKKEKKRVVKNLKYVINGLEKIVSM